MIAFHDRYGKVLLGGVNPHAQSMGLSFGDHCICSVVLSERFGTVIAIQPRDNVRVRAFITCRRGDQHDGREDGTERGEDFAYDEYPRHAESLCRPPRRILGVQMAQT